MIKVNADNIPEIKDILNEFYSGIWKNVKNQINKSFRINDEEFDKKRQSYIEKFVDNGKRKLVHEGGLGRDDIDKVIIKELLNGGLIKDAPQGGLMYYLLTHDRLIIPLLRDLRQLQANEKVAADQLRLKQEKEKAERDLKLETEKRKTQEIQQQLYIEEESRKKLEYQKKSQRRLIYISLIFIVGLIVLSAWALEKRYEAVVQRLDADSNRATADRERLNAIEQKKIAEQQREDADSSRAAADREKLFAMKQQKIAEEQKKIAEEQKNKAEMQKRELEIAKIKLNEQIDTIKAQKLELDEKSYALESHGDIMSLLVDKSLQDSLVDEIYKYKDMVKNDAAQISALKRLRGSIKLAYEGYKNYSFKDVQAANLIYSNIYTQQAMDLITKKIIKPTLEYDNFKMHLDISKGNPNIALKGTNNIVVSAADSVGTSMSLFKRGKKNPIGTKILKNTYLNCINYSCNSQHLAVGTAKNKIIIYDSTFKEICKFNLDKILLKQGNDEKDILLPRIRRISFLIFEDPTTKKLSIPILLNYEDSGSVLLKIEIADPKYPGSSEIIKNYIRNFNHQTAFINENSDIYIKILNPSSERTIDNDITDRSGDSIYSMNKKVFWGFDEYESDTNVLSTVDAWKLCKLTDFNADNHKHNNIYVSPYCNYNYNYYDSIYFQIITSRVSQKVGYKINNEYEAGILGMSNNVVSEMFSEDNHLFTLSENNNLLEWSFDADPIDDKSEILDYPPFSFTLFDSLSYGLQSLKNISIERIDQIPESWENKDLLRMLRESPFYTTGYNQTALSLDKKNTLINYKLYKLTKSEDDKLELYKSYVELSDQLIFNSKFAEGLNTALLGAELDPAQDVIYANVALGYLLTDNIDSAKKYYMDYQDRPYGGGTLCKAFLSDFNKLVVEGIIKEDDGRVKKIENLLNCK